MVLNNIYHIYNKNRIRKVKEINEYRTFARYTIIKKWNTRF